MANIAPILLLGGAAALLLAGRKGTSCPKEVQINASELKAELFLGETLKKTGDVEKAADHIFDHVMPRGCRKTDKAVTVIVRSDDVEGAERMPAPVFWQHLVILVGSFALAKGIIDQIRFEAIKHFTGIQVGKYLGDLDDKSGSIPGKSMVKQLR